MIQMYGVKLAFFYQALGSKNQQLFDQCVKTLENDWFKWFQFFDDSERSLLEQKLCIKHLHQMIFEGSCAWPIKQSKLEKQHAEVIQKAQVNPTRPISSNDKIYGDYHKVRSEISTRVLEVIFAQKPNQLIEHPTFITVDHLKSVFGPLEIKALMNKTNLQTFHFAYRGWVLADDFGDSGNYGYLSYREVRAVLQELKFYKTPEGQRYISELRTKASEAKFTLRNTTSSRINWEAISQVRQNKTFKDGLTQLKPFLRQVVENKLDYLYIVR